MSSLPSLREFEALGALLAHRTTGAAARALGVSQPAVSRLIASLERRLGRALFRRAGGLLVPTPEAVALGQAARQALGGLARLVAGGAPEAGDRLHLVTTTTLSQGLVAPALPRLLAARPGLAVQVEITSSAALIAAVADGAADVGLLDGQARQDSLVTEVLRRGSAAAVLPPGHALAARAAIAPADLAGAPMIALPRRFALRARVDRAFRQAGLAPAIAMEAATSLFAAEMVRRGLGIAILNPVPLAALYPDLGFRPFRPAIPIETLVVTPQGAAPHPALAAFLDALRASLAGDELDLAQGAPARDVAEMAERPLRRELG